MPHVDRAFAAWAEAIEELSRAEQEVIRWRLRRADPPPPGLVEPVAALRDRADFLFDVASQLTLAPVVEPI
jgi:hypothetical protein